MGGWPTGTGNINADPLYVDPVNSNLHLQSDSPCIDAGDPNSPLDPDGTLADMGAYYYDQTSPNLSVMNLIAGQMATVEFTNCTPNHTVFLVWSLAGGGPINTPYGLGYVSVPYLQRPFNTDANGLGTFSNLIPSYLSGTPIWFHGVDLGSDRMLNPLAMTIQ